MAEMTVNKAVRDGIKVCTVATGAATQTFKYDTEDEKTAIIISNSHASNAAAVTVKAGTGLRKAIGDLSVSVAAGKTAIIGPLDSMRFKDMSTGEVTVTVSGGTTELNVIAL